MIDVIVKIGRFLFYNPWAPLGVIAELLDLSRAEQGLIEDQVLFERVRIPAASERGYQVVFGLTVEGQRRLVGRFRPAGSLAEALLMQFGRLEKARRVLVEFHRANRLHWSISPWRVSRSAPYLDALASLDEGGGQASLAGLLVPMQDASVDWYVDMLKSWTRWVKAAGVAPALLLLSTPSLSEDALRMLGELCPKDLQSPVFWFSGEAVTQKDRWVLLGSSQARRQASWKPSSRVPAQTLQPEGYLKDARLRGATGNRSPCSGSVSKSQSEIAGLLAFFYRAHPSEIELLATLGRFPCLSLEAYERLYCGEKSIRKLHARMKALLSFGMAVRLERPDRYYLPSEQGVAFLAGLSGVRAEAANRYLGFPVRPGRFQTQVEHHQIAADFMLRLYLERSLSAWDFTASRYVFSNLRSPARPELRKLVILPNSSGMLSLAKERGCLFWLEVDRGTRKGKRLDAKLEKYFLAYYARLSWAPIPPLLYLIDTFNQQDEARLQEIVRRLEKLGKKHPGTPLTVLLTTGDLLRRSKGLLADARIWRRFHSETYHPDVLSLRALFEGILI